MRSRASRPSFPAEQPPPGKVWYTSTAGTHLPFSPGQRQRTLENLAREGLPRPPQYDDTPESLAVHQAESDAAGLRLAEDLRLRRVRYGYAAAGFSTALINNVFILYHVKLYTAVYAVSDGWLYAVFTLYGVWNTANDPLFGWVEDRLAGGSLTNSLQRRLYALRVGGVLLAVGFFMLFVPWWSVDPSDPPPPPWLVGAHMLVCMSCYDAALTWVCQAHNALLAELTTDNSERATLGGYSSGAMMLGSGSALISYYAWNSLSFGGYQVVCGLLACAGAMVFETAFQLLSSTAQFSTPSKPAGEVSDLGNGTPASGGGKVEAGATGGWWQEMQTFIRFAGQATSSRSLVVFLVFGLCQQLNCTFNTSFFPLMVEILLTSQLPGYVATVVLLSSFILPHALTISTTRLAARLQVSAHALLSVGACAAELTTARAVYARTGVLPNHPRVERAEAAQLRGSADRDGAGAAGPHAAVLADYAGHGCESQRNGVWLQALVPRNIRLAAQHTIACLACRCPRP